MTGAHNPALDMSIRSATLVGATATIQYTAPTDAACTAIGSTSEAYAPVGTATQVREGRGGLVTITGAAAARFVRVACGPVFADAPLSP